MIARRSPSRAAFSLVEIVAVIAIMGIMFLIAQPRLLGLVQRDRVRRAAQRVAMDVRLAQSEAIKHQSKASVVFVPDSDSYAVWLLHKSGGASQWVPVEGRMRRVAVAVDVPTAAQEEERADNALVNLATDPDYRVAIVSADFNGSSSIVFDEYGVPTSGVDGTVVVGLSKLRISITVEGPTGQVRVGDLQEVALAAVLSNVPVADATDLDPGGPGLGAGAGAGAGAEEEGGAGAGEGGSGGASAPGAKAAAAAKANEDPE
jgi:prepilin-type N-terminal cleavage/methylation domain-containing protein